MIPKKSTPIKNEILIDIFAKGKLSQIEMRIIFYIIRWSWGFDGIGRRQDWTKRITKRQMAKDIRLGESKIGRVLNIMIKEEKIIEKDKCYQFNEHHEKWKINNTKCGISKTLRDKILERDDYTCQYCSKSNWKDEVKLEVDHIMPISKGGTDDKSNLITSCRKCNREKMNKIIKVDEKTTSKVDEKTSLSCQKDSSKLTKRQVELDNSSSSADLKPLQDKPLPDRKETLKDTYKETLKEKGDIFIKAWKDFKEMRKKIKKPMTNKAEEMLLNNLNKLTKDEKEQVIILNQSIFHCWQSVYPLKVDNSNIGEEGVKEKKVILKLTDKQIEANKQRISKLVNGLKDKLEIEKGGN